MAKTHDQDVRDGEELAGQGLQRLRTRPRRALGLAYPEPQTEADSEEYELLNYTFVEPGEGDYRSLDRFLRHVNRLKQTPFRGHMRK